MPVRASSVGRRRTGLDALPLVVEEEEDAWRELDKDDAWGREEEEDTWPDADGRLLLPLPLPLWLWLWL